VRRALTIGFALGAFVFIDMCDGFPVGTLVGAVVGEFVAELHMLQV